jgi:lipopolysaccharide heptosyltransferase I
MALSRILIIKLSSLGDVIHALPVAGALRRRFPGAQISWLVGPASAGVVTICRHVDRVITWAPGGRPRLDLLAELRQVGPQVCLDLQGLIRTACIARLSGARWRIGFRTTQEGGFALCNLRVIPARTDIHAVDAYLEFARFLGADRAAPDFGLELPMPARQMGARIAGVSGGAPTVALLPGTQWATKKWPAHHFAQLGAGLARLGLRCVVLGSGADREAGAAIAAAAPNSTTDLTGRTSLVESAYIIANCALAVGNDSGPMHLAAALGVPVVALFGPTDPARTAPYGRGHVVLQAPVPCLRCRRRRCPVSCMERITPELVLGAVRQRLGLSA